MAVIVKQINDPLPRPRDLNPQLPEPVENLLIKALAKDANDRYMDMQQFAAAMQDVLDQAVPTPTATPLQADLKLPPDTEQILVDDSTQIEPIITSPDMAGQATSVCTTRISEPLADMATRVEFASSSPAGTAQSKRRSGIPIWIWLGLAVIVIGGLAFGALNLFKPKFSAGQPTAGMAVVLPEATEAPAAAVPVEPTEMPPEPAALPGAGVRVCQVTDTSGFDDRSFNATTWQGIQKALQEFGIEAAFLESRNESDYEKNLDQFEQEGCSLIISSGFLIGDATFSSAINHANQRFSIVDFSYDPPVNNILSQTFRTNQASFLAGYLAAAMSETGKVGTFGGLPIPPVTAFMDGFTRGVFYYNDIKGAQVQVLGWDLDNPDGGRFTMDFDDPNPGRELTAVMIDEGADIILPVAGQAGLGALDIAMGRGNILIIGVDSDWSLLNPEFESVILTSVLKRMDQTTFYVIQSLIEDNFHGGNLDGTLENGGVDLAPFHLLEDRVSPELREELQDIRDSIITGDIRLD